MKIMFIGAAHEVTGSCHYLEVGSNKILVDCGMEQGANIYENMPLPVSFAQIDYVFLTHAHIDHAGLLPLAYANGFRGRVFTTKATENLCQIMLKDSAYIQEMEAEWKNRKARRSGKQEVEPLYHIQDAIGVMEHFVPCNYDEKVLVNEDVSVRFIDVGHLLGSASIELWLQEGGAERKIVFSGDIGNYNKPLIKDPNYCESADYVVMESTYGGRNHKKNCNHVEELAKIIEMTLNRGGNVVLPAFAVGRTQELLYYIRKIKADGLVKGHEGFEVYVDSPLAVEATGVFQMNLKDVYDEETKALVEQGINPISFPGLKLTVTAEESKNINFVHKPKVIISASGMCDAGRIRHHMKHNLWRKDSCIVFAGYQAEGTLGRILQDGATSVKLFGEEIEVEATIETLHDISGHADQAGLLRWVNEFKVKPKQIFVVHGSDQVCDDFSILLKEQFNLNAEAPFSGASYDLINGQWIEITIGIPIEKQEDVSKTKQSKKASNVYTRLSSAGERLLRVINGNEGGANKDLARFADQINALCDKWER